jgi:hypothetical protein
LIQAVRPLKLSFHLVALFHATAAGEQTLVKVSAYKTILNQPARRLADDDFVVACQSAQAESPV